MNIFELAAKISLDDKGFKTGIAAAKKTFTALGKAATGTVKLATKAGGALIGIGEKTVNAFETAGRAAIDAGGKVQTLGETVAKVTAGISAAIAAGTAGLVKLSTDQFAEYEQLVGGVETLFKDSAAVVQTYANYAYKTAGLSANEYMSTVTSFSASLLQSLGGDTKAAAEYANQALVDMSDNANKMGTDMSLIQNAYQGFAKQNYTMLDNLKLGYGGTKTEMERLVADAAKLDDSIDASSLSFGNIVKAIHAVQTEMGITGTTAKEAATTIQGAANMTKASWKNLLTALAKGNRNYGKELSALIDSAGTYVENLFPRVKNVLGSIYNIIDTRLVEGGNFLVKLFGDASNALPQVLSKVQHLFKKTVDFIGSKKTDIITAASNVFGGLLEGFTTTVNTALPLIGDFLPTAIEKIFSFKSTVFDVGMNIVGTVAESIGNNADRLSDAFFGAVNSIFTSINNNYPRLKEGGLKLFGALLDGLTVNGPKLITGISDILRDFIKSLRSSGTIKKLSEAARTVFGTIKESFSLVMEDLMPLVSDLVPIIAEGLITKYDILLNAGFDVLMAIADGLASNAGELSSAAVGAIDKLVAKIAQPEVLDKLIESGKKIVSSLGSAITKNLDSILGSAGDIIDAIVTELGKEETLEGLADGAVDIIDSIASFLGDNLGDIGKGVVNIIERLVKAFSTEENLKKLEEAVPKIIDGLCDFIKALADPNKVASIMEAAIAVVGALAKGMLSKEALSALWDTAETIVMSIMEPFTDLEMWKAALSSDPNDLHEYLERQRKIEEKIRNGQVGFGGGARDGSHRNGLSYVPYDGYIAELHEGERVLTRSEARDYNSGGSGLTVNVTVNGARYSDEESLAEAVAEKIQEKIERERAVYA